MNLSNAAARATLLRRNLQKFGAELFAIQSLDLVTLRGHALIELALKDLLARRLGTSVATLPDLTFARLVSLGVAGMPSELGEVLLHINRIRNYVAHHVHAKELDSRIDEFFRERRRFGIAWSECQQKRYVWAAALGLVASATGTLSDVLEAFRTGQRELRMEALGRDEPSLLSEIGDAAVERLDLASWLTAEHMRRHGPDGVSHAPSSGEHS